MGRLLHSTEAGVRRWEIRPNCSLTPTQTLGCYAGVCLPCSLLALVFGWLGYPLIAGFVLLELLGLGGALLVYTRHAVDHETLTLDAEGLQIEILRGETLTRLYLQRAGCACASAGGPPAWWSSASRAGGCWWAGI